MHYRTIQLNTYTQTNDLKIIIYKKPTIEKMFTKYGLPNE